MTMLDHFYERMYEAQSTPIQDGQLSRLTIAVEALGDAVAQLEARIATLEASPAQPAGVDPLRLLDLSELARRVGWSRATVGKLRAQLPIVTIPSGSGTLPFVREQDMIDWIESHKKAA